MTKMTAGHLEAVRASRSGYEYDAEHNCMTERERDKCLVIAARLSEVVAHIAAQIRENDDE